MCRLGPTSKPSSHSAQARAAYERRCRAYVTQRAGRKQQRGAADSIKATVRAGWSRRCG
jgi:hypothetical protein